MMWTDYLMSATQIVGWAFQTEEFHSGCLPEAFRADTPEGVDTKIEEWAKAEGITDPADDPLMHSTEHVPQPIFASEADCRYCDGCHAGLIEGQ